MFSASSKLRDYLGFFTVTNLFCFWANACPLRFFSNKNVQLEFFKSRFLFISIVKWFDFSILEISCSLCNISCLNVFWRYMKKAIEKYLIVLVTHLSIEDKSSKDRKLYLYLRLFCWHSSSIVMNTGNFTKIYLFHFYLKKMCLKMYKLWGFFEYCLHHT